MTAPAVIDPAPRRLLYEHARWLFDAEEARLSSIESRSTTLLGWAGTQLTLILGATALLAPLDTSGWKTVGLWLLAVTVLASVVAIAVLLANVMRTSTVPAAHRDLRDKLNELNTETFESDDRRYTEIHVAQPLAENLIGPERSIPMVLSPTWQRRSTTVRSGSTSPPPQSDSRSRQRPRPPCPS